MYALDETLPTFRDFLHEMYFGNEWAKLSCVSFSLKLAAEVLIECGVDASKAPDLCFEQNLRKLTRVPMAFDAHVYAHYKKTAQEKLREFHGKEAPSEDPSFRSFSLEKAERVISTVVDSEGFSPFLPGAYGAEEMALFWRKEEVPDTKFSLYTHMRARMTSHSMIAADLIVHSGSNEVANVSIGKLAGVGFWSANKSNNFATIERLEASFREPILLSSLFFKLISENQ